MSKLPLLTCLGKIVKEIKWWKFIYINMQATKIIPRVASIIGHNSGVGTYNLYVFKLFRLSDTNSSSYGDRRLVVFLN